MSHASASIVVTARGRNKMLTYLYIFILGLICVPAGWAVWLLTQSAMLFAAVYLILGIIFISLVYRD